MSKSSVQPGERLDLSGLADQSLADALRKQYTDGQKKWINGTCYRYENGEWLSTGESDGDCS